MLIRSVGQESTHARGDQSDAVVHPPFVATGFASLWARDSPIFFMAFVDCGIPEIYACPSTVLVQGVVKRLTQSVLVQGRQFSILCSPAD
jgi:hypothetical protein